MFLTVDRSTRRGVSFSFTAGEKHVDNWTVVSDRLDSAGIGGGGKAKVAMKVSTLDGSEKFFCFTSFRTCEHINCIYSNEGLRLHNKYKFSRRK